MQVDRDGSKYHEFTSHFIANLEIYPEEKMKKLILSGLFLLVLFIGLVFISQEVSAAKNSPDEIVAQQSTGPAGSQAGLEDPDQLISFTISNPYCYQPNPVLDQCSLNFRFIQAVDDQSNSPYMTWLAVTISNKVRYNATAFFEGTITYSYDMAPDGLIVPCGAPNAGGAGDMYGNVYSVVVQPLDSNRNPMSTDIANITCPAFAP
jgi:hypothetical protein